MSGAVIVVFRSFNFHDSHNKEFMNRSRFSGPYCTGIAGPVSAHLTKRELWYPLVMWKVIVTDHFCYVNGTSIIFSVKQRAKKWMFFMNVYFWFLLKVRKSRKEILVSSIFQKKNVKNWRISALESNKWSNQKFHYVKHPLITNYGLFNTISA